MPIFIKENQELKDNMYEIPDKLEKHLKQTLSKYGDYTQNKGYKRLNSLVNPEYNKRSDKADQFKDGKHITFTDMKRIDHDFRHMNKNPKDLNRILNGGDEMAHFVKDTLNKERTKVKPIDSVPEVNDNNKNQLKPNIKPMKPIQLGDVSANVHENKKIYIKENQLNLLKEYRNQLTIPFDGVNGKYNYEHFIDYLENIGTYGVLEQTSKPKINDFVDDNIIKSFNFYLEEMDEDFNDKFIDFIKSKSNNLNNIFSIPNYTEYIEDEYYDDLMDYYLSDYGKQEWKNYLFDIFEDEIYYWGFPERIKQNERGLIIIERAITVPDLLNKSYSIYGERNNDFYNFLNKRYDDGIGCYWSWYEGKPYCGGSYDKSQTIYLKGCVDPINVDWDETIAKQAYSLNEEMEIKIKPQSPIEISEIITTNGKHLPLKKPIIVKA